MVVAGTDEAVDRNNSIPARTVLNHHRLTPARGEPFGDQACADVGARTWPERQDELNRPLRPSLRRHRRHRKHKRKQRGRSDAEPSLHVGHDVIQDLTRRTVLIVGDRANSVKPRMRLGSVEPIKNEAPGVLHTRLLRCLRLPTRRSNSVRMSAIGELAGIERDLPMTCLSIRAGPNVAGLLDSQVVESEKPPGLASRLLNTAVVRTVSRLPSNAASPR